MKLDDLLERISAWAVAKGDIRGVLLVGSYARGTARPDSDVDLVILANDPSRFLQDKSWTSFFGTVDALEEEDYGGVISVFAHYRNGFEVEFGFAKVSWASADPIDSGTKQIVSDGARIIYDPDKKFRNLLSAVTATRTTEFPLEGGRTNPSVTLIDGKVHRSQGPNADFAHRFLIHADSVGLTCVPKFFGVDNQGREILNYIPGTVPKDLGHFNDKQICAAARIIRQFHDSSRNFAGLEPGEVVCHNDLSPCNFVFQEQRPVAIIDFDSAQPGKSDWDIAYALWLWLDIGNSDFSPVEQGRRIKMFCQEYGISPSGMVEKIQARQNFHIHANKSVQPKTAQWALECRSWIGNHMTDLLAALA